VWQFPKPVIAAIDGPAFGGGFDLCLLCDMRIASPAAVFAHPEIKFGAPPLFTPLQWIVGAGIARELCLTGRTVDAAEAHRIGLVNAVVDAERLETKRLRPLGSWPRHRNPPSKPPSDISSPTRVSRSTKPSRSNTIASSTSFSSGTSASSLTARILVRRLPAVT
jgi:enoyl-CoA hydratase/carnithine racemase